MPRGSCSESDCPKGETHALVRITEEKMSDVNLATHLLMDGFLGRYDVAIVITNDTDLSTPIEVVQEKTGALAKVVRPLLSRNRYPSTRLGQVASSVKDINPSRRSLLKASQFPSEMEDSKGKFYKPDSW
jgi:hypothetical protein